MEKLILLTCEDCHRVQIADKWVEPTPETLAQLEKFYAVNPTYGKCDSCKLHSALTFAAGATT